MIHLDTPIPIVITALWCAAAIVTAVAVYVRQRRLMQPAYAWLLAGLRLGGILLFLPLFLQPYREAREPDPDTFTVSVLADCSGSMRTRDVADDRSRLDIVEASLRGDTGESLNARLGTNYKLTTRLFTDDVRRYAGGALGALPGKTAVGDALDNVLAESERGHLGAVLLLSDGKSNSGVPVMEVAKKYRRAGIPVTAVGIGTPGAVGDLKLAGPSRAVSVTRGDDVSLPVTIHNTFGEQKEVEIRFSENGTEKARRQVTVASGSDETLTFSAAPRRAGVHVYRFAMTPPPEDRMPETDVDYAAVEARDPDVFEILYLAARLDWDYKFLKLTADANKQLELSAVIRTGKESFHRAGDRVAEGEDAYPADPDVINAFDVIIVQSDAVAEMAPQTLAILEGFVGERGGGLVCLGSVEGVPESFRKLLPVAETAGRLPAGEGYFEASAQFIFSEESAASLLASPGPFVPDRAPLHAGVKLKPGARPALSLPGSDDTALSAQRYGSGRTAHLGIGASWRWRLADEQNKTRHTVFWNNLLVWLGASTKPRVSMPFDGRKHDVDEMVRVSATIRGSDFRPANNARVDAAITTPDGRTEKIPLALAAEAAGTYSARFTPAEAGEYRVRLTAVTGKGDRLVREAYFLAGYTGAEMADTQYNESLLRDVSRITGGKFIPYHDRADLARLPLRSDLPVKAVRHYWTDFWILLGLILVIVGSEWFLRRRIGLK